MNNADDTASQFRALHERDHAFVIPNPWDIGSARILAGLGFEALATTSAGFAYTLGRVDGSRSVDLDEALEHCRALVRTTDLPVTADLENGYADDPHGVAATIGAAAATGLAGCSIEDATGVDHGIYDFAHAVERIAAAAEAARALPHDFILTARAENYLHERPDLDDTIRRLQAFEAAGADVVYAPGLPDVAAIAQVCAAVSKPVNVVISAWAAEVRLDELAAAGVKRVSLGSAFARAALGGLLRAANEVRQQGTFTFVSDMASFATLDPFMEQS